MSNDPSRTDVETCRDCVATADRRDFLRHALAATVGALVAIGMPGVLAADVLPTAMAPLRRIRNNPVYPIPAQDGVQIDKTNQVILVRWKNSVYAFNLSCPHQNTALRWHAEDGRFECPKHHSKYQPDGTFISGRATRSMDRFSLSRSGNDVVVNVGAMHKDDVDHAGWSSSVIAVT
jgi:Rieske Fe-S protein